MILLSYCVQDQKHCHSFMHLHVVIQCQHLLGKVKRQNDRPGMCLRMSQKYSDSWVLLVSVWPKLELPTIYLIQVTFKEPLCKILCLSHQLKWNLAKILLKFWPKPLHYTETIYLIYSFNSIDLRNAFMKYTFW